MAPNQGFDVARSPILVVGAGPVGLTLAVDLARRRIPVRIIDQLPRPTDESRAIALHARTLDQLEPLGVTERLIATGTKSTGIEFHSERRCLAHVAFDTIDSLHPFSLTTPQTETERVLAQRLSELGVQVERQVELTGLSQDEHGVAVTVKHEAGAVRIITAPFVVGADGARSVVRQASGQTLEGTFRGETFLLGDVEADYDYERCAFHVFFSPGNGTGLLFPMGGRRARVFAQIPRASDPDRRPSLEWLREALAARSMNVAVESARWLTCFEIHHALVRRYRVGRIFLAGDAAHVHSPAGGQGMNTGIQDALNLGWKLALAWRGRANELLLDSYHRERHPAAEHVIQFSARLTTLGTLSSPALCRLRDGAVKATLSRRSAQRAMADEVEQQHVRCRESPLVNGANAVLCAGDYLRDVPELGVTSALGDPATAEASAHVALIVADQEGVTSTVPLERATAVILVRERALRRRLGFDHGGGVVLVRPDGYIGLVARSTQPELVRAYLARLAAAA
jgi:2-polyprenyl-6-methoxyphenol hydroxylase-like FAD-dependent oxidoreductase